MPFYLMNSLNPPPTSLLGLRQHDTIRQVCGLVRTMANHLIQKRSVYVQLSELENLLLSPTPNLSLCLFFIFQYPMWLWFLRLSSIKKISFNKFCQKQSQGKLSTCLSCENQNTRALTNTKFNTVLLTLELSLLCNFLRVRD